MYKVRFCSFRYPAHMQVCTVVLTIIEFTPLLYHECLVHFSDLNKF